MDEFAGFMKLANHLLQIIAVGFAAAYLIRAWQTGSLFAQYIANLETDALVELSKTRFGDRPLGNRLAEKLQDLLLCPLCLSPYVCCVLLSVLFLGEAFPSPLTASISRLAWLTVAIFAAAQIAYMLRRDPIH